METLIETFSAYPVWKKVLIIAGLPLVLVFLFVRGASTIAALLNSGDRAKTDDQSAKLDQQIQATANQVAKEEGKTEQLESDKNDAVKSQETTDGASFYNNRFKPDGK